jgi:hypothetical protein
MASGARFVSVAGYAVLAAVALLALGGAASAPGAILLGWPTTHAAALVLVAVVAVALLAPGRGGIGLGLLPLIALLGAGLPVPGLRALSGPPLLALALAGVVLALSGGVHPLVRRLLVPGLLVVYIGAALRAQEQVGPEGDEPHYLMVADSLWRDGDVSLENDYALGRYRAFYPKPLSPHYRVRGKHGEIYSLHALGLSLLVLPAYVLGGYPAASLFMALLGVWLVLEVRGLLAESTGRAEIADGVALALGLSPPLLSYSGIILTEVPAALAVAFVLRRGHRVRDCPLPRFAALGTAIALLPWLNVRYAAISIVLAVYLLLERPRPKAALALFAPLLLSALAIGAYHFSLYGFFDPRLVYGRHPELSLSIIPEGLPGLFFDQEFGLLAYAPAFALALPGLLPLWRQDRRQCLAASALVVVVVGTAAIWPMWRGGFNPPARFLVPIVPALALGVGLALRRGVAAGAALLLGFSLWVGLAGAWQPRLIHRDRDGTAPFFRLESGAEEWTRLLPRYVLEDPERTRLTGVWAGAIALALWAKRRPGDARGLALASGGLLLAASMASAVSHAPTGGRDAVRTVGRPALQVPGWRLVNPAPARWGPGDLGFPPVYEPHRHPDGALLGSRLALPPGRYELRLEAQDLDAVAPSGLVEIRPEGGGLPRLMALERCAVGWAASFSVRPGERAVTLVLRGGGAFVLKELQLGIQPSWAPAV